MASAAASLQHLGSEMPAYGRLLYARTLLYRSEYAQAIENAEQAVRELQGGDSLWAAPAALHVKASALGYLGRLGETHQTLTDAFDRDFGVGEWHGTNAFIRDDAGAVFRTYFVDQRGDEAMGSTWSYLDITALGRQETWEDSPEGYPQTEPYGWWNRHDEY